MRIPAKTMETVMEQILLQHGAEAENAALTARIFTQSSVDGVYSHGVNRFSRLIGAVDRGVVDPKVRPVCTVRTGCMERWDGRRGLGTVNAHLAMERACALAKEQGMGLVALENTNHWMRGGTYGWQAADQGCIGICWTNTMPNMPAWGSVEASAGNNPLVIAVPHSGAEHVVFDCAMSQFAYGRLEQARRRGEQLPVPGGWDAQGRLTTDPGAVEQTRRLLPLGYWKGSGLAVMLDLMAAMLSGGRTTGEIGRAGLEETDLCQIFLAMDPAALGGDTDRVVEQVVHFVCGAAPQDPASPPRVPGQRERAVREENRRLGVPVDPDVWDEILRLQR